MPPSMVVEQTVVAQAPTQRVAVAAASGRGSDRNYVATTTSAAVAGNAAATAPAVSRAEASSNISQPVEDRARADGVQAAAFATLLPTRDDAAAAIAGNTNVELAIAGQQVLALGFLGGAYSVDGSAISAQLFSSSIDLNIDMAGIGNTNLLVGMLDPATLGDHGFDSLSFRINIEGAQVADITFNDVATAENYFNDNVLSFGLWQDLVGTDNVLDMSFNFDLTELHLGEGFNTNFVVSEGAAVVPVPAALWLFSSGLMGLLVIVRRRKSCS